uniref:DAGKc domain-containing protein n=1 Tax=Schistocephalus solidus TaxID=70667 RepID=A0A183S9I5_SCHSO
LHMAGLDVQMVYLDDDNEVKDFVNVIDPSSTDAIVVAGDDGLLAKKSTRLWDIPVYVLPLGIWNNFAARFTYDTDLVSWCFKMVEPIISKQSGRRNVIEIKPIVQNEDVHQQPAPDQVTESYAEAHKKSADCDKGSSKSVFAMSGMEWSCWRDVEYGGGGFSLTASRMSSHKPRIPAEFTWWSLSQCFKRLGAFFRHSWCWLRSPAPPLGTGDNVDKFFAASDTVPQTQQKSLFGKPKPIRRAMVKQGKIVMTHACPGCSKCWRSKNRLAARVQPTPPAYTTTRFGRLFNLTSYKSPANNTSASKPSQLPVTNTSQSKAQESDANRENPLCGTETTLVLSHAARIAFIPDRVGHRHCTHHQCFKCLILFVLLSFETNFCPRKCARQLISLLPFQVRVSLH